MDAAGCVVSELVNEIKPTGSYEIQINSSDLKPGIYFYSILTGKGLIARKLVIY